MAHLSPSSASPSPPPVPRSSSPLAPPVLPPLLLPVLSLRPPAHPPKLVRSPTASRRWGIACTTRRMTRWLARRGSSPFHRLLPLGVIVSRWADVAVLGVAGVSKPVWSSVVPRRSRCFGKFASRSSAAGILGSGALSPSPSPSPCSHSLCSPSSSPDQDLVVQISRLAPEAVVEDGAVVAATLGAGCVGPGLLSGPLVRAGLLLGAGPLVPTFSAESFPPLVGDTSPTYLYFLIVPCYYIIHLGCFICIYMLFYMIFGTNLLT
ncbi:hypothetical protein VPH35_039160 [Triticum aestivum]